jgi:uncharacterized membrane protein
MSAKKLTENEDKSCQKEVKTIREKRIMNAVVNTSIILMGTLMGGFTELVMNASGAMASGMAEALGGEEAGREVRQGVKQKLPEVNDKMKAMMSDMRKDIYLQIEQKRKEIEPFLSDAVFDVGPKKIDEYNFGLPKLTEELDDDALAQYTYLLVSEDATFAELFIALSEWINTLPALPSKTDSK